MEKLRKSGERNSTVYIIFHRLERGERSEDLLQALSAEMPDIFALSADKPDQAPAGYPVRMQRTEKGAPSIEGRPDLYLSISHSGGWWVCAIAGIPVGIDLEFPRFRKDETEDSLAKRVKHLSARFFTQEEADYVAEGVLKSEKNADMGKITETEAGSDSACIRRFLTLWTAREAYVKCLGTGIRGKVLGHSRQNMLRICRGL